MRYALVSLLCIPFLLLTACGANSTPTPLPTIVLGANPISSSGNNVTALGQVVPSQRAQLSFPMTGLVKTVNVKAGDLVASGQPLVVLDTALLDAQVKEAQANLAAAQSQLHYLVRIGTDQEHLDSAQADIDRAQAEVDSANATLAQATLTAPFNATIGEIDISPAETVVPGQIVIVIGNLDHFQIETTDLSERDIPNVQIGQTATISIKAFSQQQFTGKVSQVAHVASMVGGDVVYKVIIDLDQQSKGLRWDMTANVSIQTGP
jgi:membrane fusion protein, multidrug efflux system